MTNVKRIIPCLDICKGRVVKGVNFVDLRDTGDPVEIATAYNNSGADELVFLDIMAWAEQRKVTVDVVSKTAEKVSIPFTVGGGIGTIEDIDIILKAGADKVSINSAALKRPELISEASLQFGSQCIVIAIDVKRRANGSDWDVYLNGGRINSGKDALDWAAEVERKGAGEILLTSMDRDGTKAGYDIELVRAVSSKVKIPVIASGGAGKMEHFYEALTDGMADAVLAASLFHYKEVSIADLKRYLKDKGIAVHIRNEGW